LSSAPLVSAQLAQYSAREYHHFAAIDSGIAVHGNVPAVRCVGERESEQRLESFVGDAANARIQLRASEALGVVQNQHRREVSVEQAMQITPIAHVRRVARVNELLRKRRICLLELGSFLIRHHLRVINRLAVCQNAFTTHPIAYVL